MGILSKDIRGKKVLITGADGFTGKYLSTALYDKGFNIIRLGKSDSENHKLIYCDLTKKEEIRKVIEKTSPDYVIHLAAVTFVGESDIESFYNVNLFGTLNLLEALFSQKYPPSKIIIASSANIYGAPNVDAIDESVCPAPVNHYANSKLAMENAVRFWFDRLPIIITRPFNYTGPGQSERFLIPKIVGHFKRGEKSIRLGNTDVRRDFSDVKDVVECYSRLLTSEASSLVVNICSGNAISLNDIIKIVGDIAGYDISVKVDQSLVRTNEIKFLRGNNLFLKKLIKFVPETPIRDILRGMYML